MTNIHIHAIEFTLEIENELGESEVTLWLGDRCSRLVLKIDFERNVILYNGLLSKSLCKSISEEILSLYAKTPEEFTFKADLTSHYFNKVEDFKELEEF